MRKQDRWREFKDERKGKSIPCVSFPGSFSLSGPARKSGFASALLEAREGVDADGWGFLIRRRRSGGLENRASDAYPVTAAVTCEGRMNGFPA